MHFSFNHSKQKNTKKKAIQSIDTTHATLHTNMTKRFSKYILVGIVDGAVVGSLLGIVDGWLVGLNVGF